MMLAVLRSPLVSSAVRSSGGQFQGLRALSASAGTTTDSSPAGDNADGGEIYSEELDLEKDYRVCRRAFKGSPRKFNLLANQIAGLPVSEAITQMELTKKRKGKNMRHVLYSAINKANMEDGLEAEELFVKESLVGKGLYLARQRHHSKGRFGVMHHKHTHVTVVLGRQDPENPIPQFGLPSKGKLKRAARKDGQKQKVEDEVRAQLEATGRLVLPGAKDDDVLRGRRKRKFWYMEKIAERLRADGEFPPVAAAAEDLSKSDLV